MHKISMGTVQCRSMKVATGLATKNIVSARVRAEESQL
jgi:hypothetical protein